MAYTINLTDGSVFATVTDGTINTDSSLTIIGKNFSGYGEFLGENFVQLLESGADQTAPNQPLVGQIWYDKGSSILNVWNGSIWRQIGSTFSAPQPPQGAVEGDLWFDTINNQLNAFDGAAWILIGPAFVAGSGKSGAIVEVITDNATNDHTVVVLYVEDARVAIWNKDAEFTPNQTISGFATIKPGVHLSTSISDVLFQGTATNSQLLDNLDSSQFLRSDASDTTTGSIGVANDTGVTIGVNGDLSISVSGPDATIKNVTSNGDLILGVNDGGQQKAVITVDGLTGKALVNENPTDSLGIATKGYIDSSINGIGSTALLRDGSNTITGVLTPDTNVTRNLGSSTQRFNTVFAVTFDGVASSAEYADIAERFEADSIYLPGTVVELGGVAEITKAIKSLSDNVFGVISTKAAYLLNSKAGTDETHPGVALHGRVPVRVVGEVSKGDRLVSAGNGIARVATHAECTLFNIIGRSLENKKSKGEGIVEAIVKTN